MKRPSFLPDDIVVATPSVLAAEFQRHRQGSTRTGDLFPVILFRPKNVERNERGKTNEKV
jgi:hypothetical protein